MSVLEGNLTRLGLFALLFLALAAPGASGAVSNGSIAAAYTGKVKIKSCKSATTSSGRSLKVVSAMRSSDSTLKMQVSYTVYERYYSKSWKDVTPAKLSQGFSKGPGINGFTHSEAIGNLSAPAQYRVVATMTWSKDGQQVYKITKKSNVCRLKPKQSQADLVAGDIDIAESLSDSTSYEYSFTVTNIGSLPAKNFKVDLYIGTTKVATRVISELLPNRSVAVKAVRTKCSSGAVSGTADSAMAVEEYSETNNSNAVSCPAPGV